MPALDNISKDIMALFKDYDKATEISNIRTLKEIPIGGDLFYWWFAHEEKKPSEGGRSMNTILKEMGLPPLSELETLPPLPKLPAL